MGQGVGVWNLEEARRQMLGWLVDAGVLLVLVLAFPLVILLVGTPVALVVRLVIEISRRWW